MYVCIYACMLIRWQARPRQAEKERDRERERERERERDRKEIERDGVRESSSNLHPRLI